MRYSKITFVTCSMLALVVFCIRCSENNSSGDPRGPLYAGSKVCADCHKDVSKVYAHTAHFQTSSAANSNELAKFVASANTVFRYNDSSQVSIMVQGSSYFQQHIADGKTIRSEPLNIAIGSSEKAQTYGYWKNDQLFQLPLTYLSALHGWTNSPGYPVKQPYFGRVIEARCLECHASFVDKIEVAAGALEVAEKLNPASLVYGIDCERCHGPAAAHVRFQQENPAVKEARFIVAIKSLSRQRQLELCAVCHSGNDLDVQRTLFAYRPGDTLANFFFPHFSSGSANPDVHGKQLQLLQMSKCFQQSNMTCTTCHGAHSEADNDRRAFITKCMTCHQHSQHAVSLQLADKSCMDCHMPLQVSKALNFNDGSGRYKIPYLLRTHRIAVYDSSGIK